MLLLRIGAERALKPEPGQELVGRKQCSAGPLGPAASGNRRPVWAGAARPTSGGPRHHHRASRLSQSVPVELRTAHLPTNNMPAALFNPVEISNEAE